MTTQAVVMVGGVRLSPREHEVMALVIEGARDKEISRKCGLTLDAAQSTIVRIRRKLNAKNRAHAAVIYVRSQQNPENDAVQTR